MQKKKTLEKEMKSLQDRSPCKDFISLKTLRKRYMYNQLKLDGRIHYWVESKHDVYQNSYIVIA